MNNPEYDYLFVTGNGYDHLESLLKTIYGQRAEFKNSLDRFLDGEEFRNCTKFPSSIGEIQTLTPDSIKKTILLKIVKKALLALFYPLKSV